MKITLTISSGEMLEALRAALVNAAAGMSAPDERALLAQVDAEAKRLGFILPPTVL